MTTVKTRIKTEICDVLTGKVIKSNPWRENLVMDAGLNALAQNGSGVGAARPSNAALNMIVGSGNSPNAIVNGSITFTQSGTTLTASGGFFTSDMVGGIFKYGTGSGGAEYYVTGFTSSTAVTVDTSATVSTPDVGTVWMVQKTALDNVLYASDGYDTGTGNCQTTFAGGQATHQRILTISQKGSQYTVNEIGYNPHTLGSTTNTVIGRFVLSSSDVVGTSNFYRVTIQIICNYSPASPSSVGNVGTNINTAGTAMVEDLGFVHVVNANGTETTIVSNAGFDAGNTNVLVFMTATYSQLSTPVATGSGLAVTPLNSGTGASWIYAALRGTMTLTFSFSFGTSGQTLYGIYMYSGTSQQYVSFDVKFTTPQTAPNGTFAGTIVFTQVYGRTLTN